jgi:hypothetical protein
MPGQQIQDQGAGNIGLRDQVCRTQCIQNFNFRQVSWTIFTCVRFDLLYLAPSTRSIEAIGHALGAAKHKILWRWSHESDGGYFQLVLAVEGRVAVGLGAWRSIRLTLHFFVYLQLFGESAGAISMYVRPTMRITFSVPLNATSTPFNSGLQLFYNGGVDEKLFRGFIAESGSPIPVGNLSLGQAYFDNVVSRCGCTKAADQVQCLREVDYGTFAQAVNSNPGIVTNYRSLALAYVPRVDGDTLRELPQEQGRPDTYHWVDTKLWLTLTYPRAIVSKARKGNFVRVPAITGDNTDEG